MFSLYLWVFCDFAYHEVYNILYHYSCLCEFVSNTFLFITVSLSKISSLKPNRAVRKSHLLKFQISKYFYLYPNYKALLWKFVTSVRHLQLCTAFAFWETCLYGFWQTCFCYIFCYFLLTPYFLYS